jgi:ribosomal protein L19E
MMGRLEGVRPIGRPRKRWMDDVRTDAKELLKVKDWKAKALDRNEWRHIIGKAKARFGL